VEQYLRLSGDFDPYLTILSIDKGQAFKYWRRGWPNGNKMSVPHDSRWWPADAGCDHPNTVAGRLSKQLLNGERPTGFADLRLCRPAAQRTGAPPNDDIESAEKFERFLTRMRSIPDATYRNILTPYAQHCPHLVGPAKEQFLNEATAHKNNILRVFQEWHKTGLSFSAVDGLDSLSID